MLPAWRAVTDASLVCGRCEMRVQMLMGTTVSAYEQPMLESAPPPPAGVCTAHYMDYSPLAQPCANDFAKGGMYSQDNTVSRMEVRRCPSRRCPSACLPLPFGVVGLLHAPRIGATMLVTLSLTRGSPSAPAAGVVLGHQGGLRHVLESAQLWQPLSMVQLPWLHCVRAVCHYAKVAAGGGGREGGFQRDIPQTEACVLVRTH